MGRLLLLVQRKQPKHPPSPLLCVLTVTYRTFKSTSTQYTVKYTVSGICNCAILNPVYTIQPVIHPVVKPVDNRLYRVYKHLPGCQTGFTTGLATGCIM